MAGTSICTCNAYSNGRPWLMFGVVISSFILGFYLAFNFSGVAQHKYSPSLLLFNYTQSRTTTITPHLPIVPVEDADTYETLPEYNGVPNETYQTDWWKSAAYIQWDLQHRPTDYRCKNIKPVGNWWICMDRKYKIEKPCLVYSFGIANDFRFDDDMAQHGCEVHSFDPSMETDDYTRTSSVHFHAIGLSNYTDTKFVPRKDIYVKTSTRWTIMTLQLIMTALGHKDRTLDILKMDIERHEWEVIDNLFQDKMFPKIRQLILEYHLFVNWPLKSDYPKLLRTYKKLHDIGYKKYVTNMHPLRHIPEQFNMQADVAYVNTRYKLTRNKWMKLTRQKIWNLT